MFPIAHENLPGLSSLKNVAGLHIPLCFPPIHHFFLSDSSQRRRNWLAVEMATTSCVSFAEPLALSSRRECRVGCSLSQWDSGEFPPEGTDTHQALQSLPTLFTSTPTECMFVAPPALLVSVLSQQGVEKTNLMSHIACFYAKSTNMFSRTYFPVSEL